MPKRLEVLRQVVGRSFFWRANLSPGVICLPNSSKTVLIDTGIDDQSAQALSAGLNSAGLEPCAIVNTHSHADHCGGNAFLQQQYPDLEICSASVVESMFIQHPELEPRMFSGGAHPIKSLRQHKVIQAKPSLVTRQLPYQDQIISLGGADFLIVTLPGHSPGMIGILSPDQVLYPGDAFFGRETLRRHPLLFYTDIQSTLNSFNKMQLLFENNKARHCVLYHGGYIDDPLALLKEHTQLVLNTANKICDIVRKKDSLCIDVLTQQVLSMFGISSSILNFTLTRTVVNAYVSFLESDNEVTLTTDNHLLVVKPNANKFV